MQRIYIFLLFVFSFSTHANDTFQDVSFYFLGTAWHFEPTSETNEGNMEYFALSKSYDFGEWRVESGEWGWYFYR